MTDRVGPSDEAVGYELRLVGHLDEHWSTWFGGMSLSHENDGTTSLRGTAIDQAELHGLLAQVRDLGVTLISVTPLPDPGRYVRHDAARVPGDRRR